MGKPTGETAFLFENYKNDDGEQIPAWFVTGDQMYPWEGTYEPENENMILNMAARAGTTALDLCYDLMLDVDGPHGGVLWRPLFGYAGNNDNVVAALETDNLIPGFDDAGAHNTILTDATCATSTISYYGRQRTRGRTL